MDHLCYYFFTNFFKNGKKRIRYSKIRKQHGGQILMKRRFKTDFERGPPDPENEGYMKRKWILMKVVCRFLTHLAPPSYRGVLWQPSYVSFPLPFFVISNFSSLLYTTLNLLCSKVQVCGLIGSFVTCLVLFIFLFSIIVQY